MQTLSTTDADLFASMVVPPEGSMPRESAEAILKWRFPPAAHDGMRELLQKNSDDTITPTERETLERYRRIGKIRQHPSGPGPASLGRGFSTAVSAHLREFVAARADYRCGLNSLRFGTARYGFE